MNFPRIPTVAVIAVLLLIPGAFVLAGVLPVAKVLCGAAWFFPLAGMAFGLRDEQVSVTKALPNGAASIQTDGIDLGHGAQGDFLADCEFEIVAPALTTTQLPDAQTMTYIVQHDTASDFSSAATLLASALVQTGAGGAGAAAATVRVRLPSTCNRYVRVQATKSGAGDASGASVIFRGVF